MKFNKQAWSIVKVVLKKIMKILRDWEIICKEEEMRILLSGLELLTQELLKIGNI
jgi:hypothetical protein